jgi:hypothetical protein
MTVYVVFCKDFEHKKGEIVGILVERRKNMTRQTKWESGTKWARQAFGHLVKDKKDLFIFPKEMEINDERLLVEKGIFTKEEYLELEKKINQEMKGRAK